MVFPAPSLRTIHADLTQWSLPQEFHKFFDVTVTSPPYKLEDGYSKQLMDYLGVLVEFSLKPGGRFFLNFGQLRDDFNRPFEAREAIVGDARDFYAGQTIIWVKSVAIDDLQKGHYQPIRSKKILNYGHEFIFTFFKDHEAEIDRLSLGVPYADKSNLNRQTRGKNGDVHCAGDVWFVPYKTTGRKAKKRHRYEFPEPLVERCLRLSNVKPGGTVFEPFCGSGTTAVVAKRLGLNAVVVDKDKENLEIARERWYEA